MKHLTRKKSLAVFTILLLLLASLFILCPLVGQVKLDLTQVFARTPGDPSSFIFFNLRLPRLLLAALVGASLAASGVVFQALLRNPLASPFTLGVASGGSLGAVVAIRLGLPFTVFGLTSLPAFSFLGALIAVGIVFLIARRKQSLSTATLLLAGVTAAFFFSALILLVYYFSDFTQTGQMIRWMMGGMDVVNYSAPLSLLPFFIVGVSLLLSVARDLNLISTGDEAARTRGVNTERVKLTSYLAASLITGAAVSMSGPISFVGLIVPHALRMIVGPDHRLLLPASLLAGAAFLMLCDTLSRSILPGSEIPVGVLTACLGGPFFVWILRSRGKRLLF
jgi:iron complex transport system permease protein